MVLNGERIGGYFFIRSGDEHMPESFASLLDDLICMSAAVPKIHCSVGVPQLALNAVFRTSCCRTMAAAWSSAQAHFPCCLCAPNVLGNSVDILVALMEEECHT